MRIIRVPHSGKGLIDYKGEDRNLFSGFNSIKDSTDFWCYYKGNSGEDVWETYVPPEPEPINYGTKITKLAMRNRFTFTEKVAIEDAAKTDSQVKVFMDDLMASNYVDLSREDTQMGVGMIEQKGLISTGRGDEILSAPVKEQEVP